MPRNSSGIYSLPQPPFVAGTVISSSAMNSDLSDIATALTGSLATNGSSAMTGQLKGSDGSTTSPAISFSTETTTGLYHNTGVLGVTIQGTSVGTFTSSGWTGAVTSVIGSNGAVPVGTVVDFAGSTAPTFWALCFGQAVSRTAFAALFTALGTTWGSGDGVTTFNLPDYRGTTTFGLDNMGGSTAGRLTSTFYGSSPIVLGNRGGSQSHTLIIAEMPVHTHSNTLSDPGHVHVNPSNSVANSGNGPAFAGNSSEATTFATQSATTGITINNAAQGSGNAHAIINPALVVNKIIFAGA